MDPLDDDDALSQFLSSSHAFSPVAPLALVVGLGAGLPLLRRLSESRTLKPLAAAASAADGVVSVAASRRRSAASVLKLLLKSYKATRALLPSASLLPPPPFSSSKRLKAAFAAANLVRYALFPVSAAAAGEGAFGLGLAVLKGGYKISKNFGRVLEGFVGLQIDSGVRNGVDALGVAVRMVGLVVEIGAWVGAQWRRRWRRRKLCPLPTQRRKRNCCLLLEMAALKDTVSHWSPSDIGELVMLVEESHNHLPELFYLSIPLTEAMYMNHI